MILDVYLYLHVYKILNTEDSLKDFRNSLMCQKCFPDNLLRLHFNIVNFYSIKTAIIATVLNV